MSAFRRLDEVCEISMGQAPDGNAYNDTGDGWPLIAGAGDFGDGYPKPKKFTREASRLSRQGDIVLGIRASIGEKVIADGEYCLGRGVAGLRVNAELEPRFLWHWLTSITPTLLSKARGATFLQVNKSDIGELEISLPLLPEQRRIAAILDQAETLRTQRRTALALLDSLTQSLFLDMFGDPATNPKGWEGMSLGNTALKFSDGPFGSNLKSSHYTDTGVRVIRLQNIGVGKFIDKDRAFVSEEHFETLRKHECLPGDVLVGTLGDPNLRACIQPKSLERSLNKADCVQLRPNPKIATAEFLCALLNQPTVEAMAHDLMQGQTRVRISMGRLRGLVVPIPPVELQQTFATRIAAIEALKATHRRALAALDALFAALQQRAFAGAL